MPKINAGDININYELEGSGQTIVFINGITMDTNGWTYQSPFFSQWFQVLRYDCRGQGLSDKPDHEYSQHMHSEDLFNLLKALNIKRIHLIGLSNGGMIAQHFALGHPEMLISLTLVDTCCYIDKLLYLMIDVWIKATEIGGNEFRYDVSLPLIFSETFIENNEENLDKMKENNISINSPAAVLNLIRATKTHDLRERISEIKCPTLIIAGQHDILIPPRHSELLHKKINNSEYITISDCGHVPSIEKPDEFNEIVYGFISKFKNG